MPSCCRSTLTFGASGPGMSRFQYAILPRSMPMSVIMPVRRVLRIRAPGDGGVVQAMMKQRSEAANATKPGACWPVEPKAFEGQEERRIQDHGDRRTASLQHCAGPG